MRLTRLLRFSAKPPKQDPAQDWRWKFSGLTWKDMKKHYAIIPIYVMTIIAGGMAGGYVYRLASKHPEVSWTKANPEPWNDYRARQYKFVSSGRDYSKGSSAPPYK
ncbi:Cytochrome c oxidase subunit NDUFA4 [Orchesella cincta]|uniref:Cytochrome c oxidase subunit NDUFA4 n=1 Tax=Orchesella cincta TaxID=48709 RepID=A0A1D2M717_ORCCI|nr:Cytochrome c oxidase subunit NDUFA4 [Orchesella cincta]